MQYKQLIGLAAPFKSYSGYGQYARAVAMMLIQSYQYDENVSICLLPLSTDGLTSYQQINLEDTKYNKLLKYISSDPSDAFNNFFDIMITVSIPQAFINKGVYNIGVTAIAQADKVHPVLIQHCNRMNQVWVMSQYNIQSIKSSIFKLADNKTLSISSKLAKVAPPVIISDISSASSNITDFLDSIPQQFLFLSVSQWLPGALGNDRKDVGALISTFISTFNGDKNVGLVLKLDQGRSGSLSQYYIRQRISDVYNRMGVTQQTCNIYIITGNLSQSQLIELYMHSKIKAMTTFTHGESFGLTLMQFSALTGKPLLSPYHSGLVQYIRPEYTQIISHKNTSIPTQHMHTYLKEFVTPDSKWFTVQYPQASYKLRQMVKNYNSYLQRASLQQKSILQQFDLGKKSRQLKKIIDNILEGVQ